MLKDPLNIALLDLDALIKAENLKEVTSEFIRESSSNRFHPEGLFSEEIFGEIASQKRQLTCGYIKLNCRVFHPVIFQNLKAIKRFYIEIMAGTSYAVWNPEEGDFEHALESERNAKTGMSFFLKYFDKINFRKNNSLKRNDKIDVIEKYKKTRLIDKLIVIPAGIRDIKDEGGRVEKDSINSLYASLLRNARSMSPGADTNPFFDTVHYTIQRRVMEIYDALLQLTSGKKGFFESKYSKRNVARSTRNVVTATDLDAASPDSPQYHKIDETKVPLFQAAKAAADLLVYWYKTLFYDQFVNMSSENVAAINAKTHVLEYVKLDPKDKDRFTTSEGVEKTIDRFRDPFNRFKPVTIYSDGKPYYLFMVYDRGNMVNIVRNVDEFKQMIKDSGGTFDEKLLRPITNIEMLYIACYSAYIGVHATTTRYPVTDEQSIFVSKTHLVTTSPARVVRLARGYKEDPADLVLPEYPIEGAKFIDALMIHPTRLKSLNADFDGNCVTGDTTVEIRFKKEWMDTCISFLDDYDEDTPEWVDLNNTIEYFDKCVHTIRDKWMYATVKIGMFPKLGEFTRDKHYAKVYEVPSGIEVRSYWDGKDVYLPIEKYTVEENCKVSEVIIGNKKVRVSNNESLAAFNHFNGTLSKVTPGTVHDRLVPYICEATSFAPKSSVKKDSDYHTGYKAGQGCLELDEIKTYQLSKVTTPYKAGYLAAILDKYGSLMDGIKTGVVATIGVNNDYELEKVREMLYVLGINSSVVHNRVSTRKDAATTNREIMLSVSDLWKYVRYFEFASMANRLALDKLKQWKKVLPDLIPITCNEKRQLIRMAKEIGNHDDAAKFCMMTKFAYDRILLMKYVSNDGSPLANRVYSMSVRWGELSSLKRCARLETVYDFVVPVSKVYAVNNGLIIYDTCSWVPIFSKEANDECAKYLKTSGNYMLPSGKPLAEMMDDLCKISFHALTRDVPELKKK